MSGILNKALKAVTRPQGEEISFVKVGDFNRHGKEYEVVRIDALYFYAACADENLPHYYNRYLQARASLQALEKQALENEAKTPTEGASESETIEPVQDSALAQKIGKQKEVVKNLYRQYRHMSMAARHYLHYRMYENVMELIAEGVDTKRTAQLEKALEEYYQRFKDTGFNYYLRKLSDLPTNSIVKTENTFGPKDDPFVLFNPKTQTVINPRNEEQSLPMDFMDPGLKIFNHEKRLETYIQHFDDVHHNATLPVEARIQLVSLNEHQAKNAIVNPQQWEDEKYHKTEFATPFDDADELENCSYEVDVSTAPQSDSKPVSLERPISPTQKWIGRIGLTLNFGFTVLGMVGVFAGLSMMIPLWPAAIATGVLFAVDLLRNKDDFYDQLLRWGKQYETSHPYKTGFHYKGLMQTTTRRFLVSSMLRALVGLEFFAVAVPGGKGLVDGGKDVFGRLFGQLKKNNTWYQLINPLFYVAAIGCVMVSFFVPATAWSDYWGLHTKEVKPEHRYNHERTLLQLEHSAGYARLLADFASATQVAELQDRNEFLFESYDLEHSAESHIQDSELGRHQPDRQDVPVLLAYKGGSINVSMDKRDVDFETARARPRLTA